MAESINQERDKLLTRLEREHEQLRETVEELALRVQNRAYGLAQWLAVGFAGLVLLDVLVRVVRRSGR